MNKLTKQFFEANRSAMFHGHPQVMTIAYTKQNKAGERKALRYLSRCFRIDASRVADWVDVSSDQIERLKAATKRLKSVQGFAVLTNPTGNFEDWNVELIDGRI
tara:strand:- start:17 stop:328 length:312 start_codon:yes stop_codon:yes gene_type:complete